jgi:hypothetical protein
MKDRELKRMLEQAVFNTSEKAGNNSVQSLLYSMIYYYS